MIEPFWETIFGQIERKKLETFLESSIKLRDMSQ